MNYIPRENIHETRNKSAEIENHFRNTTHRSQGSGIGNRKYEKG